MAPVATTMASHLDGVTDSQRARELYKYYQPTSSAPEKPESEVTAEEEPISDIKVKSNITSSKISSPDTALTAFCQLVTWRLGVQRAMISVIDAQTQYFIAEGTKTVDLVDNNKHAAGDEIWIGCAAVKKAGRLCERTIAVKPTEGRYPYFVVDDLSKDERFSSLPFVTGSPFMRFYAGVPLITKRGIPIGSLFVVDDRVGHGLSQDKAHFMGTMAVTIMRHMEMSREVEEHRRGMKMSRGLASFVEGRAELAEAEVEAEDNEGTKIVGQFETEPSIRTSRSKGSVRSSVSQLGPATVEGKEREYAASLSRTEQAIFAASEEGLSKSRPDLEAQSQQTSYETSITISSPNDPNDKATSPTDPNSESTAMKVLFSRAANLIREAFEVDGGCVFYDAQKGIGSEKAHRQGPHEDENSCTESVTDSLAEMGTGLQGSDTDTSPRDVCSDEESRKPAPTSSLQGGGSVEIGDSAFSHTTSTAPKPCDLLGFSTADAASINGDPVPGPEAFKALEEKTLMLLLTRYPRGKLWNFDSDGAVSSSSGDEAQKPLSVDPLKRSKEVRQRNVKNKQSKSVAKILLRYFPGVRQLLFVPLWNAGSSRWLSACFAWSTEPTRILSKQSELAFLSAFGNSVMAEWSRIDTEIADQKKTDFIGSISHELRSPLHGILASAEFLEENTTGWERGLVETIDSCGRTLLDTINHILDYSKINHFEKNWRKNKGRPRGFTGKPGGSLTLQQSDLPMLNLFQALDIAVLAEEVVDSVFAGHVFQHTTAQSFDQVAEARGKMADATKSPGDTSMSQKIQLSEVVVIIDVDCHNYHFTTQPGALRRLIMNLLGNALKYTSHGYVKISLSATDMDGFSIAPEGSSAGSDHVPRSMIQLIVEDTGRGISPDFLRSKLFMPFAQENSLSSGTGLGLSIVRKIVSLLEGDITIDSEVGRGTRVKVTLPLLRDMPRTVSSAASSSTQRSIMSVARDTDATIQHLQTQATGYRASLHNFDFETKDPVLRDMNRLLQNSITTFLVNWYGMRIVPPGQNCELIISNEATPAMLETLITSYTKSPKSKTPAIVVLSSHSTRFDRSTHTSTASLSFIAKPVGPLKLAKAISQCLPGAPFVPTPRPEAHSSESSDLSAVFEELSMSPRGGEVLDNTRMATDSANARKAIESPTPGAVAEKGAEFPFPDTKEEKGEGLTPPRTGMAENKASPTSKVKAIPRPAIPPRTSSTEKAPLTIFANSKPLLPPSALTQQPSLAFQPMPDPKTKVKLESPTLLLVDDNQINIRLLSTYLTRRNYNVVHQAMDGLQAVNMVEARPQGYDIIFMDITMPVLDGFGATKLIRSIEDRRRKGSPRPAGDSVSPLSGGRYDHLKSTGEVGGKGAAALVIAFTGRSSIEDQNEAARVGIDLFMTKPVAFKEVGKICDNWAANRARGS